MSELLLGGSSIDRRRMMQGTAAGALMLGAGTMPARATPKRGGKLRIGMAHGQTSDSLDPGTHENGFTAALVFNYSIYLT